MLIKKTLNLMVLFIKKMVVLIIKNKNKKKEKVGLVLNGRYC